MFAWEIQSQITKVTQDIEYLEEKLKELDKINDAISDRHVLGTELAGQGDYDGYYMTGSRFKEIQSNEVTTIKSYNTTLRTKIEGIKSDIQSKINKQNARVTELESDYRLAEAKEEEERKEAQG